MHTSPLVTLTGCILGGSRAHTVGGEGEGELRNLITLLHPSSFSPSTPLILLLQLAPLVSCIPHRLPTLPPNQNLLEINSKL